MLLKGEAANTNLIVWFEATKDRVHDLFIDGNTLTFTQQIVPHKERKKITVHPFLCKFDLYVFSTTLNYVLFILLC
jgi:hypothetical protein